MTNSSNQAPENSDSPSDAGDPPPVKDLSKQLTIAPSLIAYFGPSPISAPAFLKAVTLAKILRFPEEEIHEAEQLMLVNDADAGRLCALVSQSGMPDAINRWIWPAVQQRLKVAAPDAFAADELDSAALFRSLLGHFTPALTSSDKAQCKHAELLIRLSLAWLITQRSLSLWSALEQLRPTFFRDTAASVRVVRRILTRGKMREIKEASCVAGLSQELVRTALAQKEQEQRRQINLQGQLIAAQSENTVLHGRVAQLEEERKSVAEQLAAARLRLEEGKQHWGHDMAEAKAQQNKLLNDRLAPLLSDARDALEIEPSAPQVALKRLKAALSAIEETAR